MDRAGVPDDRAWIVTLWTADGAQAARITGIDRKDTALLTAARALVGADVTLPRCVRARIEGYDRRARREVSWWVGEVPPEPPTPPAVPDAPPTPAAKQGRRWPWSR